MHRIRANRLAVHSVFVCNRPIAVGPGSNLSNPLRGCLICSVNPFPLNTRYLEQVPATVNMPARSRAKSLFRASSPFSRLAIAFGRMAPWTMWCAAQRNFSPECSKILVAGSLNLEAQVPPLRRRSTRSECSSAAWPSRQTMRPRAQ